MTTGIATLDRVIADSFVSYSPSFTGGKKVWEAKGFLWVGAGSSDHLSKFRIWTLGKGKRPVVEKADSEDESAKLEVLQVKPDGIFLWINDAFAEFVDSPFFAVGSGGSYAMGAMSAGASPEQAIEIAAKWDSSTRGPIHSLTFTRKRRGA